MAAMALASPLAQLMFKCPFNNNNNSKRKGVFLFSEREHAIVKNYSSNISAAMTLSKDSTSSLSNNVEVGNLHRDMKRLSHGNELDLYHCRRLHKLILKLGLEHDVYLGSKLISMYALCGSVKDARHVFYKMSHKRDVVLWTSMINACASNALHDEALELYFKMLALGMHPDDFTFSSALKACAGLSALEEGKLVHVDVSKRGFHSNVFVGSALVDMYAKCGRIEEARQMFDKMSQRNVVSWNTIISGFQQNEEAVEAMEYFDRMLEDDNVKPDSDTFVSILTACTHLEDLHLGKQIHAQVMKFDLESHVFIRSALVGMYGQCRRLDAARRVFDRLFERNVVLWSAMIAAYCHNGCANEALELFLKIDQSIVKLDAVTIAGIVPAFAESAHLKQGKEIHGYAIRNEMESNVHVGSALIAMYAQCKKLKAARRLFNRMSERNVVIWNAMITAYAHHGRANKALKLLRRMHHNAVEPDPFTVSGVLRACAHLTSLGYGKEIHGYAIKNNIDSNMHIGSALIEMYTQCKRVESARLVFDGTSETERDVILWSAMISSHAQNGFADDAFKLFRQMHHNGVEPDLIAIAGVLPACAEIPSLKLGKEIHCYAIKNTMESNIHVGSALITMYSQCSRLEDARRVFNRIESPKK